MLLFLGKILIAHYQRLQLHKQRQPVLIQRLNGILKGPASTALPEVPTEKCIVA
jgi:hypothetical protein